jgi:hypothetical protein
MKDFLDNEISVGDTIVYVTRQSSTMRMHKAEVLVVEEERIRVKRRNDFYDKDVVTWLQESAYIVDVTPSTSSF